MWTTVLLFSLLNVQLFAYSSPEKNHLPKITEKHESGRVTVQGAGALRNYTISFVPLLAVLANMIPQLIPRLQPTVTTTTHARKLGTINAWEETSLCRLSKLKRWPSPNDDCEYYACTYNVSTSPDCPEQMVKELEENAEKVRMIPLKQCSYLQLYRCTEKYYFNKTTKKCEQCYDQSSCC